MKNQLAALEHLALFSFLMIGLPAAGAGSPGTQGPRFLGAGLDEPKIVNGIYMAGPIQEFILDGNQFPPATSRPQPSMAIPTPIFQLDQLTCVPDPRNSAFLAKCSALVVTTVTPATAPSVCKEPNPPGNRRVKLIALKAKWDPANTALDFNASNSVVFACEDSSPGTPDPKDKIGAFGKCVGAGFFERTPIGMSKFQACVRAMRADYCGIGQSLTLEGTPLAIYDHPPPPRSVLCKSDKCFEASWDEKGARCINHARYEHLVLLSTIQAAYERPPANRTRIDGLEVCGAQYGPIAECVALYKDFFYDDDHLMGTGVSPIDAVTSQFVCKSGAKRRFPEAVLTRTSVRFVTSTGVDTLRCCDTLKCP
jgi:hypothetical protein